MIVSKAQLERRNQIVGATILVLIALGVGGYFFLKGRDGTSSETAAPTPTVTDPETPVQAQASLKPAFEAIRDTSLALSDDEKRAAWIKEFEQATEPDKLGELDDLLRKMAAAGGATLEVPSTEAAPAPASKDQVPQGGIGIVLELPKKSEILKSLPRDATEADITNALRISEKNPLVIARIIFDSPASRPQVSAIIRSGNDDKVGKIQREFQDFKLKVGQSIVLVGHKFTNGMTMSEVIAAIRGPVGTTVDIRVTDVDKDDYPLQVQYWLTREPIRMRGTDLTVLHNGAHVLAPLYLTSDQEIADFVAAGAKCKDASAIILDLRKLGSINPDGAAALIESFVPQGSGFAVHDRAKSVRLWVNVGERSAWMGTTKSDKNTLIGRARDRYPLIGAIHVPVVVLVASTERKTCVDTGLMAYCLRNGRKTSIVGDRVSMALPLFSRVELPHGRALSIPSAVARPLGRLTNTTLIPDIEVDPINLDLEKSDDIHFALKTAQ